MVPTYLTLAGGTCACGWCGGDITCTSQLTSLSRRFRVTTVFFAIHAMSTRNRLKTVLCCKTCSSRSWIYLRISLIFRKVATSYSHWNDSWVNHRQQDHAVHFRLDGYSTVPPEIKSAQMRKQRLLMFVGGFLASVAVLSMFWISLCKFMTIKSSITICAN